MTASYLYRFDNLAALRKQARDPWLRARRIRQQPASFPHDQLGEALQRCPRDAGVYRLSMWRSLQFALPDLNGQYLRAQGPGMAVNDPLILQRIRGDHPFFATYQRGEDQYLRGQAWLYWNTAPSQVDQDWSSDGISHRDIEVYHPHGYWVPFQEVIASQDAPPPPVAGWTRVKLQPLVRIEQERTVDARWIDHPTFGSVLFARIPAWSQGVWATDVDTRLQLEDQLLKEFPDLIVKGRLFVSLERSAYTVLCEVDVRRIPATTPNWFRRAVHREVAQPAKANFTAANVLSPQEADVESFYAAAGLSSSPILPAAFVYGQSALAKLADEAANEAT